MKDQWEYNRVYDAGIVIDGGGLQTTFQEKRGSVAYWANLERAPWVVPLWEGGGATHGKEVTILHLNFSP